jgi:hypothetical protein
MKKAEWVGRFVSIRLSVEAEDQRWAVDAFTDDVFLSKREAPKGVMTILRQNFSLL